MSTEHPVFSPDTLKKTGIDIIEVIMRRRRILKAGFVAHMEDTRRSKWLMLGELIGGASCGEGRIKSGCGVSWTTSELSVSTPTSE